ncbi:MAG: hypothetical protein MJK15_03250 [Colwellia sp.]|nr:hypothetical protein [Colwellia sp.]
MKTKILINSKTSGKFTRETIDGRSHLVTTMMPIRGDITMNNKFYPDKEVKNSFMQLNMLPAPNGHPSVNGIKVPAFHPVANNKHNIGGFLRNPRKKGKRVFVDFMLDEEIANNSEDGKETIRRIENGERIGVSTGLTIDRIDNKSGEDDFGKAYNQEVGGFGFDHVAILLNEEAAGKHAGTELVLNENDESIEVNSLELNELSTSELHEGLNELIRTRQEGVFSWVRDIFPDSKTFVFSVEARNEGQKLFKQTYAIDQNDELVLVEDRVEVEEKREFIKKQTLNNTNEVKAMDKNAIVLAIIGNSANKFTIANQAELLAMDDNALVTLISNTDEDGAKLVLTNSGFDFKSYEAFLVNKDKFDVYLEAEDVRVDKIKGEITENSDYTAEMLVNKNEDELNVILGLVNNEQKPAKRIPEGTLSHIKTNSAESAEVNFDFT